MTCDSHVSTRDTLRNGIQHNQRQSILDVSHFPNQESRLIASLLDEERQVWLMTCGVFEVYCDWRFYRGRHV